MSAAPGVSPCTQMVSTAPALGEPHRLRRRLGRIGNQGVGKPARAQRSIGFVAPVGKPLRRHPQSHAAPHLEHGRAGQPEQHGAGAACLPTVPLPHRRANRPRHRAGCAPPRCTARRAVSRGRWLRPAVRPPPPAGRSAAPPSSSISPSLMAISRRPKLARSG